MELSGVEALGQRAADAYARGDLEGCLSAWEDQHRYRDRAGDHVGAAQAACMVALHLLIDTGLMTPVRAWVRRAENHLGDEDLPPAALVAMIRTYERFMCGDAVESRRQASRALELGRRHQVPAAVVMGSIAAARLDILAGRPEEGLAALDEVALLLADDYADPLTTGMAYCELICAAQGMLLDDRARDWTAVMERWRAGRAVGAIHGRCLVHQAELLRVTGPGRAAEEVAQQALTSLRPWLRREFGWPLVELGAIRLRRGDLDGAEEALLAAHERAWCPQPALALLRLEQGRPDEAAALIAEAIERPIELPWKERPPIGDLRLFPFYAAQAEIAYACLDEALTTAAAAELARIARDYPGPGLEAAAALAGARAALLRGAADAVLVRASRAAALWSEHDAPFELGQARLVLAAGHDLAGNPTAAALERRAAAESFRAYGAPRWVERAEQAGGATADRARIHGLLRIDGDLAQIDFAGRTSTLRNLVGLRTLRTLLAEPGREFHVLDLVGPAGAGAGAGDENGLGRESGLPMLDEQARAAYRRRLVEVEEDIVDAERDGDLGRLELATRDREFLVHELTAASGLGGRDRTTHDPAERARTSVTRSLRYALAAVAKQDQALADHLRLHVRTGLYCCYQPDPVAPVSWTV